MAEMLDDLETALEVEVSRGGSAPHGEATSVLESVPEQRRALAKPRGSRAGVAMGLAGLALIALIVLFVGGGPGGGGSSARLRVSSAHDFDPPPLGDGEHPDTTGLAIDGNPRTPWSTETYDTDNLNGKPGVGLYVDAGSPVSARAMEVQTSTPGWSAELRAARGPAAPLALDGWETIGQISDAPELARITVASRGDYRFYMLWITPPLPDIPSESAHQVAIQDLKLLR
jgi:hypothetical protein